MLDKIAEGIHIVLSKMGLGVGIILFIGAILSGSGMMVFCMLVLLIILYLTHKL